MGRSKEYYLVVAPRNLGVMNEYYKWLCDEMSIGSRLLCEGRLHYGQSYWMLATTLWHIPFEWTVYNDDNREVDGKKVRDDFAMDMGYFTTEESNFECSMLEMLVALARRMSDMTSEPDVYWFWVLLDNVGLGEFTDSAFNLEGGTDAVKKIVARVIDRTYKRDGSGGLFPLKFDKKDQREVELWYQMCSYLNENYSF